MADDVVYTKDIVALGAIANKLPAYVDGDSEGAGEAVAATSTATATDAGTLAATLTLGSKVYTISADGLGTDEIAQGETAEEYATGILNAVMSSPPPEIGNATQDAGPDTVTFLAADQGVAGNEIVINTSDPNLGVAPFTGGASAGADPVEPLMPVSIRIAASGGSVEGGTTAHPVAVRLVDAAGHVIAFVDDGAGGWAIPVVVVTP